MLGIKRLCVLIAVCVCIVFATYPHQKVLANAATVVYITDTGEKYHGNNCFYLNNSKKAISLSVALNRGYTACSYCHGETVYHSSSSGYNNYFISSYINSVNAQKNTNKGGFQKSDINIVLLLIATLGFIIWRKYEDYKQK